MPSGRAGSVRYFCSHQHQLEVSATSRRTASRRSRKGILHGSMLSCAPDRNADWSMAVNHPVVRHRQPGHRQERREPVGDVHDLVALASGGNPARPARQCTAYEATPSMPVKYEPSKNPAVPRCSSISSLPLSPAKTTIVSSRDAERVELVQQVAEVAVELQRGSRPSRRCRSCP